MERDLKNLLKKHGFFFKKAYGQNFLTDVNLLDEIAEKAGVTKNDTVLEIGCGAGALTRSLAKKAKRVVGYEIDCKLEPVLSEALDGTDNVSIVYKDIMKENLVDLEKRLGEDYILVANLPYYITTPIIMEFIEKAEKIKSMVIMVQEEVALRLVAVAGTSDYGAITVAINLRGDAGIIKRVPREMFTPVPNVDSAVVKIDIDRKKFPSVDFDSVRNCVRAGFSSRRKMLINNLMQAYRISRQDAEKALLCADISLTARGETLGAEDFIRLSEQLKKLIKGKNEK